MFTHSLFCIRNLTRSLRSLVRFLIRHNSCVNTVRTHFPWSILYLLHIRLPMKNPIGREHSINSSIACELGKRPREGGVWTNDMINAISAADIAFIMSSSTSAWLLNPLDCFPQKHKWIKHEGWIMWKMYNKTIIEFGFRMISWIIKTSCLCYLPQTSAWADNTDLGFDNSWYHAQPHPIIV